jgi:hypothetical protein
MISRHTKDFCEETTVIFQFLEKQKSNHQFLTANFKHVAKILKKGLLNFYPSIFCLSFLWD